MSLTPVGLTIDGVTIDLHDVLADVTIHHGRTGYFDEAQASTCQVQLLDVGQAFTRPFKLGAPLVLTVRDVAPLSAPLLLTLAGTPVFNSDSSCTIGTGDLVTAPSSLLSAARGWFAARVRPGFDSANVSSAQHAAAGWGIAATNLENYTLQYQIASWTLRRRHAGVNIDAVAPPLSFAAGDLLTVIGKWGDGLLGCSVNGGPFAFATAVAANPTDAMFGIGSRPPSPFLDGDMIWFACGMGDISDADAAMLYAQGNADTAAQRLPTSAACTMIWAAENATALTVGAGPVHQRFTGRCTDALLDVDDITIIAVGKLSTLSGYMVGAAGFPEQSWSARVAAAFTEAGLASLLQLTVPVPDPLLEAREAEPIALGEYLNQLAAMIGVAVADTPDGKILVQPISARNLTTYTLDPAEVEYAPVWSQNLPATNRVTVTYGADLSTTYEDAASVALYGPRPASVETELKNVVDADQVARSIVARQAYAHWTIAAAPLLVGRAIPIGTALNLHTLPEASPYDPWTPVLEGWTDSIVSDGSGLDWTMELALSDPLLSGLSLPWNQVPLDASHNWNTVNPATAWRDALTLDSL